MIKAVLWLIILFGAVYFKRFYASSKLAISWKRAAGFVFGAAVLFLCSKLVFPSAPELEIGPTISVLAALITIFKNGPYLFLIFLLGSMIQKFKGQPS